MTDEEFRVVIDRDVLAAARKKTQQMNLQRTIYPAKSFSVNLSRFGVQALRELASFYHLSRDNMIELLVQKTVRELKGEPEKEDRS